MRLFLILFLCFGSCLFSQPSVEPLQKTETTQTLSPSVKQGIEIQKIVSSAPLIYLFLTLLSLGAMTLWLYGLFTFRTREMMPKEFVKQLREQLETGQFAEASDLCQSHSNLLANLIHSGLCARNLGPQMMFDAMKAESKRISIPFWQKLSLLNEVVIVAPMLGLLGTVLGMFYAFYDTNRSIESINALFDGLGVAVGTTVAGLIVAIFAMIFYTTLKYRTVKALSLVENEAFSMSQFLHLPPKERPWN